MSILNLFNMKKSNNLPALLKTGLVLVILITSTLLVTAQKGRKNDEPSFTKNIPEFFINDEFIPKGLKRIYQRDASRLAQRIINKEVRLSAQNVEIHEELVKSIYNALVAIRVSDYSSIDTIAEKYNIRSFPRPNVNLLTLVFDHDAAWAKPIKQYRADTTASPALNFLIRKYNLQITKLVNLDDERSGLVLLARDPINISALARRFFVEEGIASIEEMLPWGDGNDIDAILSPDGWEINYSVRFGECLLECKSRYEWKFKVSNTGKVTFVGGGGQPIPPWIGAEKKRVEMPDKLKNKPAGKKS